MTVLAIGQPILIVVQESNREVVIDCGQIIHSSSMEGVISTIAWYKNGRRITKGSVVNVVVAANNRTITITADQVGIEGNYSCEVCTDDETCQDETSVVDVCSKYHCYNSVTELHVFILIVPPKFDKGRGIIAPPDSEEIEIRCGQNYNAQTFVGVTTVQIQCPLLRGTDTTVKAYKDGVEIDGFTGTIQFGPVPPPSDDISGLYKFVSENNCGRHVVFTRITRTGL